MTAQRQIILMAALSVTAAMFAGCSDSLWHVAQSSPSLSRLSDRMNERDLNKRFSGDPLRELDENISHGDYRFLGLSDFTIDKQWVPGVPAGSHNSSQVDYLVTDKSVTWTAAAERYFTAYNRALVPRRKGKKLDATGRASE
jgi:hypothetical protein